MSFAQADPHVLNTLNHWLAQPDSRNVCVWGGMPEKVQDKCCPNMQTKEAPVAEEMDKWCGIVVCSHLLFASVLLCIQQTEIVWLHLCMNVCVFSETPRSNRLPHCSLLGSVCFAFWPWHSAFSLLGWYACASVCECVSVLGERVKVVGQLTSEAVEW